MNLEKIDDLVDTILAIICMITIPLGVIFLFAHIRDLYGVIIDYILVISVVLALILMSVYKLLRYLKVIK